MSQSNQGVTTQAILVWQRILYYLLGMLVGAAPLLLFGLIMLVVFDVLFPNGLKALAFLVYSWIPWVSILLWIANLGLAIARRKKRLAFSLGIFTALVLLLLISPGLWLAWALSSDGFGGH